MRRAATSGLGNILSNMWLDSCGLIPKKIVGFSLTSSHLIQVSLQQSCHRIINTNQAVFYEFFGGFVGFYHISSNKNCDEEGVSKWDWVILFCSGLENNLSVSMKETEGKAAQVSDFLMSWWWGQSLYSSKVAVIIAHDCCHEAIQRQKMTIPKLFDKITKISCNSKEFSDFLVTILTLTCWIHFHIN